MNYESADDAEELLGFVHVSSSFYPKLEAYYDDRARAWVEAKKLKFQRASADRALTNVLVISAEAPIRLLCRVNLEQEGLRVREAADGPAGLEKARDEKPDLILLAVMLPGIDGLSVARELRHDPRTKEIPIAFNSARAEFCACVRELDLADVGCLSLPFNPLELATFLTGIFRQATNRRPSQPAELQDLWSLRGIATTPNDTPVDAKVERWRRARTPAGEQNRDNVL